MTVLSAATDRPHSYEWKSVDIFIMVNIMMMVMIMAMKVGGEKVDCNWLTTQIHETMQN